MNQMTGYSRIFGGKLQIDGGALKIIAVVTMFIDHLTLCFLEVVKGPDGRAILYSIPYGKVLDRIGRGIGRTAFPIFCFMVVEALIYTRSRVSYLVRMLLFAAISHYPFNWMIFSGSEKIHCSVMATLALGFLAVWIMDAMAGACLGRQYTIRAYKGLDPVREQICQYRGLRDRFRVLLRRFLRAGSRGPYRLPVWRRAAGRHFLFTLQDPRSVPGSRLGLDQLL